MGIKTITLVTTTFITLSVIGAFTVYAIQRSLIYHPERLESVEPAAWGLAQAQVIHFSTEDGLELYSWYIPAKLENQPTLLYFHGNAGHIGVQWPTMAGYIEAGYGVLLAEYRGYGKNPGSPSEASLYQDARGALHYLLSLNIPLDKIILFGESLGSGVAVQMATEFEAAGLILQAPYTSLVDVGKLHYPYLPVEALLTDRYDSLAKIKQINMPLVVVHGESDETTPVEQGKRLFTEALEPKKGIFLSGVGHTNIPDQSTIVMNFFGH